VFATLIATGCSGRAEQDGTPASNGTIARASRSGPAEHDGTRALAILDHLAGPIGPRVAGTAAEGAAAAYIAGQLSDDGYAVQTIEFTFDEDRFQPATLTVGSVNVAARSAANSNAGSVSATSAFAGLADAAGLAAVSLEGKVAVVDRGTLTFGQKAANVAAAGAIALVILNNQAGEVSASLSPPAAIPVVSVSGDNAAAVRNAARTGATIAVTSGVGTPTTARNVFARADPDTACTVLVGGHYDTVPSAPGANDNASGVANVVELARAFAADGLDKGLCFAAFSAEESGLFGSAALAQSLAAAGSLPKAMVNLDVTGIGSDVELIGDPGLVSQALRAAEGLGIAASKSALPANAGSDHLSFQQAGVPVLFLTSGEFATIHSPLDVTGDIDPAELDRVGDVAYAVIKMLLAQVAHG
jgi:Zn-dependent M28 family amino/carboxypeptidase